MKKIDYLFKSGKISKIIETERERYLNFFSNSSRENLEHCKFNLGKFSRWNIISDYYAMHDLAKLFLCDKFNLKIDFNVHQTTIDVFRELIKDKEIIESLEFGFKELNNLLNDLVSARKQRTKAQYYTGSFFMKKKYQKEAKDFLKNYVLPFIKKIQGMKNDWNS